MIGGIKSKVGQSRPCKHFERLGGPAIYGFRCYDIWKKRLVLLLTMASDHAAWERLTLIASGASLSNSGENC